MLSNKKILMVVPYKARDLEGHALVGHQLNRRYGYEVIFSNGYRLEPKILQHAPDALVLDHLSWNFKVEQAKLAKNLGMKVVILPTEGLFQDAEGAVRRAGKLHHATHLPDLYMTWGDFPRRALLEEKLMVETRVQTAGCPRFDFYCQPYLNLMPSRREFVKQFGFSQSDAPLILWATNTPYSARSAAKMLERQTKRAKKPLAEVQAHIADHKIQWREHSRVVLELARRNPQWNFIIKVHPAEWVNPYLEMEEKNPNIKVAYNSPIRPFLYHAEILLQRNCTTATEAWMFGKPVLNLEIGEYRRPVREEYATGNHPVGNTDEAEIAVKKYLAGSQIPLSQQNARSAFIKDFYYLIDGNAHQRCAQAIHEVLSGENFSAADQTRKNELTANALQCREQRENARLPNRLNDLIGFDRNSSMKFWKKLNLWKNLFAREAAQNAGLFKAEPEITPQMVEELYQIFDRLTVSESVKAQSAF